jgi:hypothetical protein
MRNVGLTLVALSITVCLAALPLTRAKAQAPESDSGAASQPTPFGFPHPPPILDADPSVRHEVTLCLPERIRVERTETTLSISFVTAPLQQVAATVGKNTVLGMETDLRVYALGDRRPEHAGRISLSSRVNLCNADEKDGYENSREILNRSPEGIPELGKRYVVEIVVTVFETDIPAQHMWTPAASKKYKVLWSGTLKTVE